MSKFYFILFLIAAGCSQGTKDWLEGVSHVTCPSSDYISVNLQNAVTTPVTLTFCSTAYAIPPSATTYDGLSGIQSFSATVATHMVETEVMSGDGCEEADVGSTQVGAAVPLLSAADQANYKFCYAPASNGNPELYSLVLQSEPCPTGTTVFAQNSVTCKQ